MNTDQKLKLTTKSSEQSLALGARLANQLRAPVTLELIGDLGGGKTTFVKGIASGLGITKVVTSPTFTIHRSYEATNATRLEHFDLYRLDEDQVVLQELTEATADNSSIVAVEWARSFESTLPADRIIISFDFIDEQTRNIELRATGPISKQALIGLA